ncbi:MAG TPA: inositol 2-dehydrogenase [Thermoleophilaceae bacterium]|nr:inositol 2-dehydrogenase [Thermoleophilaceae bacterium]
MGAVATAGTGVAPAAPVRIGVVGAGRIGRVHAGFLAGRVRGAQLAGVHDVRAEEALALAGELAVPAFDSVERMLADPQVHAVAVCSSTDTHADLTIAAARAGKAIFCEKPLSLELPDVDRVRTAVTEAGVPFQIGFNRRFDAGHRSVREAVAGGAVGEPHLVRISSRDPFPPPVEYVRVSGGIFLDMTIHDFDMARYVTGREVVEVYARGSVRIEPSYREAGDVDTALVVLEHDGGCVTAIDNSRRSTYGYDQRVEVFGSGGMAASGNPPAHAGVVLTAEGESSPVMPSFFLDRYAESYERAWQSFVDAVRDGRDPAVGVEDARAPLVIGLAAWRSLREHRPVRVAEVDAA